MAIVAGPRCGAWLDFGVSQLVKSRPIEGSYAPLTDTLACGNVSAAYSVPYKSRPCLSYCTLFLPSTEPCHLRITRVAVYQWVEPPLLNPESGKFRGLCLAGEHSFRGLALASIPLVNPPHGKCLSKVTHGRLQASS